MNEITSENGGNSWSFLLPIAKRYGFLELPQKSEYGCDWEIEI